MNNDTEKEYEPEILKLPIPVSRIWIVHDVAVTSSRPMPNRWVRFWQRIFFGWRWETIEK